MSEGLAQGLHVAAGVGFEPVTFQTQGTEPITPYKPVLINIVLNYVTA